MTDGINVDNASTSAHKNAGSESDGSGSSEGMFFENFKTPEDLAKSYKELQQKLGQQGAELGKLREAVKSKEQEDKFAQVMDKVSSLVAEKDKKPDFDYEAFEAKLSEEMAENPQKATKDLLRIVHAWQNEDRKSITGHADNKVKALESTIAEMREIMETMTEDYKENKDLVDKLRSKGMSIKDAKALAKEIRESMPQGRVEPPTGISSTRVVQSQAKETKPWTDADIEDLKRQGYDDTVINKLKEKWERDAKLSDVEKRMF